MGYDVFLWGGGCDVYGGEPLLFVEPGSLPFGVLAGGEVDELLAAVLGYFVVEVG